jgi:hypothetical protein
MEVFISQTWVQIDKFIINQIKIRKKYMKNNKCLKLNYYSYEMFYKIYYTRIWKIKLHEEKT